MSFWEEVNEAKALFVNEESGLLLAMYEDYARDMERATIESNANRRNYAHVNLTAIRSILSDRLEVK